VANKLFVYDPDFGGKDAVLATLCSYVERQGCILHIVVREPKKTREQEEKYHAMLADIARDVRLFSKKIGKESWKRVTIDAFKHDTENDPDLAPLWHTFGKSELLPALNHDGFVTVGEQSRNFGVKLASAYIEWLYAFGAENDVKWLETAKIKDHQGVRR
jgi:glycine cleavage system aminomethyltransferase T